MFDLEKIIGQLSADQKMDDPFYVEQVRNLRSKINHHAETTGEKVFGITSSVDDEGKTTLSLYLASSFSAIGDRKVLLVDCDLRKRDLTSLFRLNGTPGLREFLTDEKLPLSEIFARGKSPNLFFLGSGHSDAAPGELLSREAFKDLVRFSRERFDLVLLDLPPVVKTSDPSAVRDSVDKFILVCRAGATPHHLLNTAVEELGKEKILGVVLNGVESEKIYRYKKYYYY